MHRKFFDIVEKISLANFFTKFFNLCCHKNLFQIFGFTKIGLDFLVAKTINVKEILCCSHTSKNFDIKKK